MSEGKKERERPLSISIPGAQPLSINAKSNLYDFIFHAVYEAHEYHDSLAQLVYNITEFKEHFQLARFDNILQAAYEQNKELMLGSSQQLREEIQIHYDGYVYLGAVLKRYVNAIGKTVWEIKLPNDGFIYRSLQKFDQIDSRYWHGATHWNVLSEEQGNSFPKINSFLGEVVDNLGFINPTLDVLYHSSERRLDFVLEDNTHQFCINFESIVPFRSVEPNQRKAFKYSRVQDTSKKDKNIADTNNLFFTS